MPRNALRERPVGHGEAPSQPGSESVPERYHRLVGRGESLERVNAFSDAVFAIAMTILVLELHVPDVPPTALPAALLGLVPHYLTFALSFVVVGMIWLSHHRKFRLIQRYDQNLLRLNLLLLLLVASLAVPTALLGDAGDQVLSAVLYASLISAIGYVLVAIWLYAWRAGLVDPEVDRPVHRLLVLQSLIIPSVFLVSIPVALLAGATAGEITWALGFPATLLLRLIRTHPHRGRERTRS